MLNNTMNQKKSYFDLTREEKETIAKEAVENAITKMHAQGVASVEVIDGKQYLRHPDGSLTPINSGNAS
jgi:DNA-binding transcriptional regulator YhcF (GntR family)